MKARKENSLRFKKLLKEIPLRTRLNVLNDMMLLGALIDLGFIPDGPWSDEKEEKYGKYHQIAREMTLAQLEEIKRWKKDGKPKSRK